MPQKSTRVPLLCEQCGAPFETYPSMIARGKGRSCSLACAYQAKRRTWATPRTRRPSSLRSCEQCGSPFKVCQAILDDGNGRFCGRTCSQLSRRDQVSATCRGCGTAFQVRPSRAKSGLPLYCSRACWRVYHQAAPPEERFWRYVDKGDGSGCWLWTGGRNMQRDGYGYFALSHTPTVMVRAHRYSYMLATGERLPRSTVVMHLCHVPACVRPDHLEAGDQQRNIDQMWGAGRGRLGEQIHNAKLTADAVRDIRRRMESGSATRSNLAVEFGVTASTISYIVTRKTWRHLL